MIERLDFAVWDTIVWIGFSLLLPQLAGWGSQGDGLPWHLAWKLACSCRSLYHVRFFEFLFWLFGKKTEAPKLRLMLRTARGKDLCFGYSTCCSSDSCLFSNVALAVAEVVHVTDEHGVGKGGYDCNAGASNWMQGWPLDQTHGVFSEVIKNCLANKENTTIETVNFFNVQPTAADISSGCLGRQRRRIGAAATATASTAWNSIAMQNTCRWLVSSINSQLNQFETKKMYINYI